MAKHVQYRGEWSENACAVFRNDVLLDPLPSLQLKYICPLGFSWGVGSRGAEQLALALLLDSLHDKHFALEHYVAFAREVTSALPLRSNWYITSIDILRWMSKQLADANLN